MDESQPKISKHLAKLRDMGFVKDERQEQFIYYYLTIDNGLLKDILQKIVENIEDYPVMRSDTLKISNTKKYIDVCQRKL
jgi:ArsR family transcriptional regulator